MRYDQPPYPCPGCEQPRELDVRTWSVYCSSCPPQDHRGNPIGVLCLSQAEAIREQLRRAGRPIAEELDSMAGLAPRESHESEAQDIRRCWSDQTRSRGGKGGSSSKGRKKPAKGGVTFPGGDDHKTGDQADSTRTSRARPKRRLTSSTHSARLSGDQRRMLGDLRDWLGGLTESEAISRAIEVAHAVEAARRNSASRA